MRVSFLIILLVGLRPASACAEWKAIERVETYSISGTSGAELYQSIGEKGPAIANNSRAIAYTTFKLTWKRDYRPSGTGCTLAAAKPKLIITYLLPKSSGPLPDGLRKSWDIFYKGLLSHEKMHGQDIIAMVHEIEKVSIGLTAENDPKCQKVRKDLQAKLALISKAQRQRGKDFDILEHSPGGNVHRLILDLVNGR